jgi:PAP2 superfamily
MKTLMMIRNGEWADFDFAHVEGIISFPSFHTTLAILLVYGARHHRWLLAVLVPLNMLLIAAALSVGGHYLVDLPAGAAVAHQYRRHSAPSTATGSVPPASFARPDGPCVGLPNRVFKGFDGLRASPNAACQSQDSAQNSQNAERNNTRL